jgi:hypothetical protein
VVRLEDVLEESPRDGDVHTRLLTDLATDAILARLAVLASAAWQKPVGGGLIVIVDP